MEAIMGTVTCFAGNYAPRNYMTCNGQVLAISTNQALFSILGTTYGGNGTSTFALPDLRGRAPVSSGQGYGLQNYTLGEVTGSESATLIQDNLPPHIHQGPVQLQLDADSSEGGVSRAVGTYPAVLANAYAPSPTAGVTMAAPKYSATINPAGNNQPIDVRSPVLALTYIICVQGIYPSRN